MALLEGVGVKWYFVILICISFFFLFFFLIWNASQICMSSLHRGHANLLCIVPILVYVLPKRALICISLMISDVEHLFML